MSKYFYLQSDGNSSENPISFEEVMKNIENGVFNKKTLIWYEGMKGWKKISKIDDFRGSFKKEKRVILPPPSPFINQEQKLEEQKKIKVEIASNMEKDVEPIKKYWKEAAIVILAILFFLSKCGTSPEFVAQMSKEEIVTKYLKVVALDKTWDGNGLTPVSFKNTSTEYIFDISQIGIKHQLPSFSRKTATTFPKVNAIIQPQSSIVIDKIPIPNGVKPLSAYALMDDIKIIAK